MNADLVSIGLKFPRWQDAVEAAIGSNNLTVAGEVRGGQLVQFSDRSGAQINILAAEPYATFAGFRSESLAFANVTMLSDVIALLDVVDGAGNDVASLTANLAQGPLIADSEGLTFEQVALTAPMVDADCYDSALDYETATGEVLGLFLSPGAELVASGSGHATPDAAAEFSAEVLEAEYRRNALTGQRFIHATVDGPFAFDVCLSDREELPQKGSVVAGTAVMAGSLLNPVGGACGCGGGSCGCGGH